MKQYEAVIQAMKANGGFATLGFLYQKTLKIPGVEWQTKTPFATIRRIVQDKRFFFKVKPGLWALLEFKNKLPIDVLPSSQTSPSQQSEFNHAYYQGLLVEIGNLQNFETFIPNQDKNKEFLGKKLCEISSLSECYKFSYEFINKKAQTIDITWFNERKMPSHFFEIEYSTDIQHSLLKFVELQDFNSHFFIVADEFRFREFDAKFSSYVFKPIKERTKFLDYEKIINWHTKTFEFSTLDNEINNGNY